jgi:hypothetical protein
VVANPTGATITGWTIEFDRPPGVTVTQYRYGVVTTSGSHVTATNEFSNGTVAPGRTTEPVQLLVHRVGRRYPHQLPDQRQPLRRRHRPRARRADEPEGHREDDQDGNAHILMGKVAVALRKDVRRRRRRVQRGLNRSETRLQLRCLLIFVDQPVQHLPASHPHHGRVSDRCGKRVPVGRALPASLMWPTPVVVRQVLAEPGEQVSGVVDQDPVRALPPYRAHPALRERVRAGRRWGVGSTSTPSASNTAWRSPPS